MSFAALTPDSQMMALFLLSLVPVCFVMNRLAFRGAPEAKDPLMFFTVTPRALRRCQPLSASPRLIRRFVVFLGVCICAYWLYWQLLRDFRPPTILLSYLGALILWPVSETLGALAAFVALPSGKLLPSFHGAAPPLAKSLSDFWGRRWNVWVSEWFRQIIFCPLQNRPMVALFAVFLTSGVLHDLALNVPLYIVTGKKYFGLMTLYFLLQAVGILIEHKTRNRGVRIFLVWLFVFGAVPLMINEGMLRILHLWPE
jgi:Membrane bound O-acyl transferase family